MAEIENINQPKEKIKNMIGAVNECLNDIDDSNKIFEEFKFSAKFSQTILSVALRRLGISEISETCENEILSLPTGSIYQELIKVLDENDDLKKICLMGLSNCSINTQQEFIFCWANSQEVLIRMKAIILKGVDRENGSFRLPDGFISYGEKILESIKDSKCHYIVERQFK